VVREERSGVASARGRGERENIAVWRLTGWPACKKSMRRRPRSLSCAYGVCRERRMSIGHLPAEKFV
jgi:hypothetical protein